MSAEPIQILLLAAGESSRLGRPKQLLPWRGTTLLRHAAEVALAADLGPLTVVLGSRAEACRSALLGLPLSLCFHPAWNQGMGSSIAAGMGAIPASAAGVLILLCDQPEVTPADLHTLARSQAENGAPIVASRYAETLGPPALFGPSCFRRLRSLTGPQGAKALFAAEPELAWVECPHAARDIDTPADAACLA